MFKPSIDVTRNIRLDYISITHDSVLCQQNIKALTVNFDVFYFIIIKTFSPIRHF